MKTRLLLFVILFTSIFTATSAFAGDHEFNGVVHAIETHYGVHRTHIPLVGFAMLFARPEGISGFKLAVFEDIHPSVLTGDGDDFQHIVERSLSSDWRPFVRTRSHNDGETTLIYANFSGDKMQMLVVNIEPTEATVVEMKLSEGAIKKWMADPKEKAENEQGHHHHEEDN